METKIQTNNDSRATLEADFADANKNIPQSLFTENLTSMYENVLLWCRDYLNKPKDPLLAMALIGSYITRELTKGNKLEGLKELKENIIREFKKNDIERINHSLENIGKLPLNIEDMVSADVDCDIQDRLLVYADVEGRNGETNPGYVVELDKDKFTTEDTYQSFQETCKYDCCTDESMLEGIADMLEELELLIKEGKVAIEEEKRTPIIGREYRDGKMTLVFAPEERYYRVVPVSEE